jgi:hypothetical protein
MPPMSGLNLRNLDDAPACTGATVTDRLDELGESCASAWLRPIRPMIAGVHSADPRCSIMREADSPGGLAFAVEPPAAYSPR